MAGDWLKMRLDISEDPAVIGMADALGVDEDLVVGKLHRLWSWADRHCSTGRAPSITQKWVDRYVAQKGFADAMVVAGWLSFDEYGIEFPDFDRHNGKSAKNRADATTRKRLSRKNRDEGMTGEKRTVTPRPFRKYVFERDGETCVYCNSKHRITIDHLIPVSRGGKEVVENMACCCGACNNEKNDRTPEEFGLLPTFLQENVTYESQKMCDKRVTREEKRREENTTTGGGRFDHQGLMTIYNDMLGDKLGRVKAINPERQKHIKARVSEDPDKRFNLDWWTNYFTVVSQTPFLVGEGPPKRDTGKPWKADFDWLINGSNLLKVSEGKYEQ